MHTIFLLALLGQFDMSGEASRQFEMAGIVRSSLVMSGETTKQSEETPTKRRLDLYTIPGCPACPQAKAEVLSLRERYDVRIHEEPDEFPQWVLRQAEKSGWGYPLAHWETAEGKGLVIVWPGLQEFQRKNPDQTPKLASEAAPTPTREVERVLGLLPRPEVGFVDFGCGADARWCVAAAERWGCRVTGVEIDPERARQAKERVRSLGLNHLVTIVEGDATKVEVAADVGVAYLYADVLERLRPRAEKLRAFASYLHQPPGLPVTQNGDSWIYFRPTAQVQYQSRAAVWGGQQYSHPVCNSPTCQMCNSIRNQLGVKRPAKNSIWNQLFSE